MVNEHRLTASRSMDWRLCLNLTATVLSAVSSESIEEAEFGSSSSSKMSRSDIYQAVNSQSVVFLFLSVCVSTSEMEERGEGGSSVSISLSSDVSRCSFFDGDLLRPLLRLRGRFSCCRRLGNSQHTIRSPIPSQLLIAGWPVAPSLCRDEEVVAFS